MRPQFPGSTCREAKSPSMVSLLRPSFTAPIEGTSRRGRALRASVSVRKQWSVSRAGQEGACLHLSFLRGGRRGWGGGAEGKGPLETWSQRVAASQPPGAASAAQPGGEGSPNNLKLSLKGTLGKVVTLGTGRTGRGRHGTTGRPNWLCVLCPRPGRARGSFRTASQTRARG